MPFLFFTLLLSLPLKADFNSLKQACLYVVSWLPFR
nr:MAG TPA: hypothetical protein [Caudoviricetes sp.]